MCILGGSPRESTREIAHPKILHTHIYIYKEKTNISPIKIELNPSNSLKYMREKKNIAIFPITVFLFSGHFQSESAIIPGAIGHFSILCTGRIPLEGLVIHLDLSEKKGDEVRGLAGLTLKKK